MLLEPWIFETLNNFNLTPILRIETIETYSISELDKMIYEVPTNKLNATSNSLEYCVVIKKVKEVLL